MPILNHRDYRSAKARTAQLSSALSRNAVIHDMASNVPAEVSDARQRALKAEMRRLQDEIQAYERLRGGDIDAQAEIDPDDLGLVPILARIARRLSQRELAELLDIKEQQVQRYESERYSGIGLSRYKQTLDVLGVELQPRLSTPWTFPVQGQRTISANEINPSLIKEVRSRGWIDVPPEADDQVALQAIDALVQNGRRVSQGETLHRKNPKNDSDLDELALSIWHARVLQQSVLKRGKLRARFNLADTRWVRHLVALSVYDDGPARVEEFLRDKGILFVVQAHLPRTHLDGAALMLADGTPVIGLSLRHDRLDNFWFVLLHEIGHVLLHFNHGLESGFTDDLDVPSVNDKEIEADSFAQTALIPEEIWSSSSARFAKAIEPIRRFASANNIHTAIAVGRIRRDRNDYSLFAKWIGQGEIRRMFGTDR